MGGVVAAGCAAAAASAPIGLESGKLGVRFGLAVIAIVLVLACQSKQGAVEGWHYDMTYTMSQMFATPQECARAKQHWVGMDNARSRIGRDPERVKQVWQRYLGETGFTDFEAIYCEARFTTEAHQERCEVFAAMDVPSLNGTSAAARSFHYGVVDYCITERIPPFE